MEKKEKEDKGKRKIEQEDNYVEGKRRNPSKGEGRVIEADKAEEIRRLE